MSITKGMNETIKRMTDGEVDVLKLKEDVRQLESDNLCHDYIVLKKQLDTVQCLLDANHCEADWCGKSFYKGKAGL